MIEQVGPARNLMGLYTRAGMTMIVVVVKQCLEGGEGERGVARSLSFELAILNHVPIIAVAVTGPSHSAFPNTCSFLVLRMCQINR